jgi:hypothetical protein
MKRIKIPGCVIAGLVILVIAAAWAAILVLVDSLLNK